MMGVFVMKDNMNINWFKLSQAQSHTQYTVKDKDTLYSISQALLGDAKRWQEIAKINPQIDPNRIKAGMVINIPAAQQKKEETQRPQEQGIQLSATQEYYVVQTNDTLSSIAEKITGRMDRWKEIAAMNPGIKPNNITPGMRIIVPKREVKEKEKTVKQNSFSGSALEALKAEIARGEGDYRSYNRGKAGDTPKPSVDITKLTVGEVMTRQTSVLGRPRDFFAVGKYQFIPRTLAAAVSDKRIGVKTTDLFSPQTQEKLFIYLLYKQPAVMAYITKKSNDIDAAVNALAAEFASLPTTSGKGKYDGDKAKNKAVGGLERVEKIKDILKSLRDSGIFK